MKKGTRDLLGVASEQDTFWSKLQESVVIPAVAADIDFPDVVVSGLPADAEILSVRAVWKWRKQVDSSAGVNAIDVVDGVIRVKKSTGAWNVDDVIAIVVPDNTMHTAASATEGGDCVPADIDSDCSSEVDGNATYNFRSEETNRGDAIVVDAASLTLYDVQMGLIIRWR